MYQSLFTMYTLITSATKGEGAYVFTPVCLFFVTCKIDIFQVQYIGESIFLFCLFLCLSATGHNAKPIIMKLYQVVEVVSTGTD